MTSAAPTADQSSQLSCIAWSEKERLAALRSYDILDTPPEQAFEEITEIAALVCNAPIAVVNLIEDTRQFFKAEIGLGVRETPVDISICAHAILQEDLFVVPDTTKDPRFARNPLVTGELHLRFYAGALLVTPDGLPLGTVCVLDYQPRPEGITDEQKKILRALARSAMSQLEQRRLFAALARREAELERVQQIAGIGGLEVDLRQGLKNRRSPQYLRIHGLSPEAAEESHDDWVRRVHPDDRRRVENQFLKAVRGDARSYRAEYRITRPSDGEVRWISALAEIERDASGRAVRLVGAHQDVTESKQTEEALRRGEEHLRAVLDTMPQIVWSTRPDGYHDYFNRRWYEFTGATPEQSEGAGWNPRLHPDDQQRAFETWSRALATGQPYEVEYRLKDSLGQYRWFIGRALPVRDEIGVIERWYGTCTDVHDLKVAQEALKAGEERLRLTLDVGLIGTWVWNIPEGTITADERLAAMFHIDPQEAAAGAPVERYTEAAHPEDRSRIERILGEVVERGGVYEVEHRLVSPDGSIRWIVARGRCEHDEQGRPVRFPGATVDITELKRAEEARELITRELAHRIKNIFAVINGLVALSSRGYPESRAFADSLRERLTALAQAHEYVRPHSPDSRRPDAPGQTLLGLMRLLLAPYLQEGKERFLIRGADVPIGSKSATAIALVLHEQATNAMKYGALCSDAGYVKVTCHSSGSFYRLIWEEVGGPPVPGEPTRRGFGTELAARSVAGQLGGALAHEWARDGLVMRLTIPTQNLAR